ncbi:flagellar hook-basal body complex protein FliE [uncultured Tateyamaria sp.]|uniref:flagellar hook-basal body complex protein FliE n=1 Tax=uncultured Tateyamaria sp. TaxID=455651 RepID=UPI00260A33BD|nr:flagellar hook-basal body complex protein FliE [uncultured Tateyamaria sp.]
METATLSAVKNYAALRPATQPGQSDGGSLFGKVAMDFAQTLAQGEQVAKDAMVGQADPHSLVQALAQTELAVETAVTVRNKVVEAYQEILRMPV